MGNRSLLDEIEDYNFAVKQLIFKTKSETEVRDLLQKKGVEDSEITEYFEKVKVEYSGIKYYETCKTSRYIGHVIDNLVVFPLMFLIFYFTHTVLDLPFFLDILIFILILLVYYLPLESFGGLTLGKLITGSRVIDADFNKPSVLKVIIRTVCRILPFPWWIDRFLHDRFSGTYVVNKKKLNDRTNKPSA